MSQEPQGQPEPPRQWRRDEKDEKERDEKGRDEKGRDDALSTLVWAALFVWAGLVLLADNLGFLGDLNLQQWVGGTELGVWSIILIGAGIIVLLEVVIRLIVPAYRRSVTGSIIFAGILLAIGLGGWVGWNSIWPLFLILIGVSILVGGITRR